MEKKIHIRAFSGINLIPFLKSGHQISIYVKMAIRRTEALHDHGHKF